MGSFSPFSAWLSYCDQSRNQVRGQAFGVLTCEVQKNCRYFLSPVIDVVVVSSFSCTIWPVSVCIMYQSFDM
jgi:hypothetical protein